MAVTVPGELTIHGVSIPVEAEMEAQVVGDVVVVVGRLPLDFTEFGITMPRAPIVVSVEDAGSLEWQLFFRRETDRDRRRASVATGGPIHVGPQPSSTNVRRRVLSSTTMSVTWPSPSCSAKS